MPSAIFGRTNVAFPPVWLSLSAPHTPYDGWLEELAEAALEGNCPIDVSGQPGLWGGALRGREATLMTIGDGGISKATDDAHAGNLLMAHLIESLSAVGRETLDFYFLRIRGRLQEYQISGALAALEIARQEGHIRFLGLCCDGSSFATLASWQLHDAFEALLVQRNHYDDSAFKQLKEIAFERRVGIVTSRPLNWGYGIPFTALPGMPAEPGLEGDVIASLAQEHPVLVGVRTPEEARFAVSTGLRQPSVGLSERLDACRSAFETDSHWEQASQDHRLWVRQAAERRRASRPATLTQ